MQIIYNILIRSYYFLVLIVSLFNKKAKLWIQGRRTVWDSLSVTNFYTTKNIWIHAASLGEFEQGRPVIEYLKKNFEEYKIILTFFSPSGYEIRKKYQYADKIVYLPLDTQKNAKRFIKLIKPDMVFFIKYEFWFHYLYELNKQNIKTYLISAIFRDNQIFFKSHGSWYRQVLRFFTHIFVQNKYSLNLLKDIGVNNCTVSGDTRFDRVYELSQNVKKFAIIENFIENKNVFVCGSTWHKDEELIINFLNKKQRELKTIIAPHEVEIHNIQRLTSLIKVPYIKYSEANEQSIKDKDILIIDNIGILSSLYQYADIAYIGGGFGAGIHNTLEAATFGVPIIFGTNYHNFKEANDLIEIKAAFTVANQQEFDNCILKIIDNENIRTEAGKQAKNYVYENRGATKKIISKITFYE